jgi:hypothetical protein
VGGEQTYRFHSVTKVEGSDKWEVEWLPLDPPELPPITGRVSSEKRAELAWARLLTLKGLLSGADIIEALEG